MEKTLVCSFLSVVFIVLLAYTSCVFFVVGLNPTFYVITCVYVLHVLFMVDSIFDVVSFFSGASLV